jgi:capsular polysaccharide biosynthesis protein
VIKRRGRVEENKGLEITRILKVLRKRILIVIIIPVVFLIVSGFRSYYYYQPIYEARVSMIVGVNEYYKINPSEIYMYEGVINTFLQIARTTVVAENAAQKLNDGTLPVELQYGVNVVPLEGTQILIMSFISSDPANAVNKVEAMSQAFIEEGNRLLTNGKVQVMEKAKTPTYPINSRSVRDLFMPFAVGLVISIGIALFLEMFDNTIKDEDDVEKYLGMPVVGIIPKH